MILVQGISLHRCSPAGQLAAELMNAELAWPKKMIKKAGVGKEESRDHST
jgi:hypothetical protein